MSSVIKIYHRGLGFDDFLDPQCHGSSYPNDNSATMESHAKVMHYCQERHESGMCCVINENSLNDSASKANPKTSADGSKKLS